MVGVVREKYQLFPKNINFVYFNLSVGYFTSLAKDSWGLFLVSHQLIYWLDIEAWVDHLHNGPVWFFLALQKFLRFVLKFWCLNHFSRVRFQKKMSPYLNFLEVTMILIVNFIFFFYDVCIYKSIYLKFKNCFLIIKFKYKWKTLNCKA